MAGRDATSEQVVEAFRLTARYSGNAAKAARELGLNPDTLRKYRRQDIDLYNKVAKQELDTIRQQEAEKHLELAAEAMGLEGETIVRLRAKMNAENVDAQTLTTIGRNLATQAGIHTDKAANFLGLKDRATTVGVQVNLDLGEMVRGMAAKGAKFYDAGGKELNPGDVIDGDSDGKP